MEKIKWIFWIVMIILLFTGILAWKDEEDARNRMEREEVLIDAFLEKVEKKSMGESPVMEKKVEIQGETPPQETWSDDAWFMRNGVTYTPEFARGTLDCVLEMETIRLRRGVYIGTEEEIRHNLDVWMLTAARPDYRLGETHYCIYGHNCAGSGQEISLNRLQDVKEGEYFTLTTDSAIYLYQVAAVYGMGREEATRNLVDNFSLPSDRCYLITCGRGEYRYLDFIVEGHLVNG